MSHARPAVTPQRGTGGHIGCLVNRLPHGPQHQSALTQSALCTGTGAGVQRCAAPRSERSPHLPDGPTQRRRHPHQDSHHRRHRAADGQPVARAHRLRARAGRAAVRVGSQEAREVQAGTLLLRSRGALVWESQRPLQPSTPPPKPPLLPSTSPPPPMSAVLPLSQAPPTCAHTHPHAHTNTVFGIHQPSSHAHLRHDLPEQHDGRGRHRQRHQGADQTVHAQRQRHRRHGVEYHLEVMGAGRWGQGLAARVVGVVAAAFLWPPRLPAAARQCSPRPCPCRTPLRPS